MVYVLSGFHGQTRFQKWFMFRLSFSGLCFNGLYRAFQAETWVGLRWRAHNNLCELNAVYFGIIGYVSEIIVSCFYCFV